MGVLAITRTACHSNFNKESSGGFLCGAGTTTSEVTRF